jgi:hypothetical protein
MKLIVLSESEADEAAVRLIAEGILGIEVDWQQGLRRRSRGYASLPNLLRTHLVALHHQTDVDGLIVVVDSDETPLHRPEHEPDFEEPGCRLCQLKKIAIDFASRSRPRSSGRPLKTAIGLAAPEIEAWYLCGLEPWATEAGWLAALDSRKHATYRKRLKPAAYGIDRAPLGLMTSKARDHATRLVADLKHLEDCFQNGFGPLAREIRLWGSD